MRLVVLRALGLGDLLTGLPALRALGDAFPSYRRVLATTAGVAPLALHAGAAEDIFVTEPLASLAWTGTPPDVAVNLHGHIRWRPGPRQGGQRLGDEDVLGGTGVQGERGHAG
ncbi:MAG TPA: hypothetical protein VNT52_17445, partial [Acidimicrobiales bacterium]|nr:hypothetical protein [Acidimicrobiales bacterium]